MIISIERLSPSILLVAVPAMASAFSLGQLAVYSGPGEALDATVELYMAQNERADPFQIALLPDLFDPSRRLPEISLGGIQARFEHLTDGRSVVHLKSRFPLASPEFSFRLRATLGELSLSRTYLFTPATPRVPAAPPHHLGRRSRPAVDRRVHAVPLPTGPVYGPVRHGESLWTIAKRMSASRGTIDATMRVLYAANPEAFDNGDINRIRIGALLRLPAGMNRKLTETASLLTAPTSAPPPVQTETRAQAPIISRRDPALTKKLTMLSAKYAAIRARYSAGTDSPPVAMIVGEEMAARPALPITPTVASSIASNLVSNTPTVTPMADLPAPRTAPVMSAEVPKNTGNGLWFTLLLLMAGTAAFGLWQYLLRRRSIFSRPATAAEAPEQIVNRTAAITAKAIRHMTDGKRLSLAKNTAASAVVSGDDNPTEDVLEAAPTVASLMPSLDSTLDYIDTSIAHGRYEQAERLLQRVIAVSPQNVLAKLRLSQVYYITERADEFTALAEDIHHNGRNELSNEEWRRVVRMGRALAPNQPLFGGPRAVAVA